MLLDRTNWPRHRPWFYLFLLCTLASAGWYAYEAWTSPRWPGGSSLPGFVFGVVGGLLCLFEFLFWFRKKVRSWKIGSAQAWLRAHIWLGLLTLPLLILHSGFRFGGTLSTTLLWLLIVVVASGIWGWCMQNFLPTQLLEVPEETLVHQIDQLGAQLADDARAMVLRITGNEPAKVKGQKEEEDATVAVGLLRTPVAIPAGPLPGVKPLADFFDSSMSPYLQHGAAANESLAQPGRARLVFEQVRAQVPPEVHGVVNLFEGYCHQRRQWDRQRRIHFWLHNWLWIHFPLSIALIVLMFVHAFVALKYY